MSGKILINILISSELFMDKISCPDSDQDLMHKDVQFNFSTSIPPAFLSIGGAIDVRSSVFDIFNLNKFGDGISHEFDGGISHIICPCLLWI